MFNNQADADIVEIEIPPQQQGRPEKTLTQKKTEATLRKIAPMLAILKKEGFTDAKKKQEIINIVKNESDDVGLLADELGFLLDNQQELLALVTHVYKGNEEIIGDDQNSFINKMQETFSIKAGKILCIALIGLVIVFLMMAISALTNKFFEKGALVLWLLTLLVSISMCIIACVAGCLMTLGCAPRSLCLKVCANEELENKAMLNQLFIAPPSREVWARELDGHLNIEGMNALLTIMNDYNNYIQSVQVPIKSARTDQINESASVNPEKVKLSSSKYGTFPPVVDKGKEVEIPLDSDASVPAFT